MSEKEHIPDVSAHDFNRAVDRQPARPAMSEELKPLADEAAEFANCIEAEPAFNPATNAAVVACLRNCAAALARRAAPSAPAEVGDLVKRLEGFSTNNLGIGRASELMDEAADALTRLAASRGEVVEECARVADVIACNPPKHNDGVWPQAAREISKAIRALTTPDMGTGE